MKGIIQILIGLIILVGLVWLTFFSDMIGALTKFQQLLWQGVYLTFLGGVAWVLVLVAIALIVVGFSEINEK